MKKIFIMIFTFLVILFTIPAYAAEIELHSEAAILIEENSGQVIFNKNSNEKMYPASTTKIITALLVLENKCDLNDTTTASKEAVSSLSNGYVTSYISIGETLTIEQLLNILLIPSGNVAGNILAEYVAGSIENFVSLMNTRAFELGCSNTHFTNTYGLHNENHYTCAYDLYLITKEAMKYDTFREIIKKTSYTLPATNKYSKDDRVLYSTNDLIKPNSDYYYEYAIGGKTGYTSYAKECLVSIAEKDNMKLYAILLGCEKKDGTSAYRYSDAKKLFNYGFNNFLFRTLKNKDAVIKTISVSGATTNTKNLNAILSHTITIFINTSDTYTTFIPNITIYDISAPIKKGDIIGNISYEINGITYSADLLAESNVEKSYFFIVFDILIVLFLIMLLKKIFFRKKRRNYKKKKK